MDPAKITYHNDTKGYVSLENEGDVIYNSDYSADEIFDYESSSVEDDYYLVEDFSSFKDVTRSKKFYLKKKPLDEAKINELEDVFKEKSADDETDSEEEKIIQVVWSEDDPVQNKLVRFVESLEIKKSNSKFTLSMLDEERVSADMDSCEGEEIKGRFLEVKDSLEVLATSSRNLQGSKYSDWDFTVDEDPEVNRIWRKTDSPWTSSLQIEIGKLPSQADQETVLQVLDEGAQGKISVRDVTECLGNLLESVNQDRDVYPNKKVSFCAVPSKSCLSRESLSQTSTQSARISSQKKVSFYTENNEEEMIEDAVDKSNKNVSLYELANVDDAEALNQSEIGKIKKSVSFHDSVEFEKTEKAKDSDSSINNGSLSEANADVDSTSSTGKSSFSDKITDLYTNEEMSNHSGVEKSTISDTAASGFSLAESFSTFSTRTSFEDSIDVSECRDLSDFSLHSSQEDGAVPVHLLKFLNDQINNLADHDTNEIDSGVGVLSESSKGTEEKSDLGSDSFKKLLIDVKNEVKTSIQDMRLGDRTESKAQKIEFIRNLIEDSLNKKFDECDAYKILTATRDKFNDSKEPLMSGIGKTFKLFYDHCKEIVDIDNLSKTMGLAMAFQDTNQNYLIKSPSEDLNQDSGSSVSNFPQSMEVSYQESNNIDSLIWENLSPSTLEQNQLDDAYMSADSDGEIQISTTDPSFSYTLDNYIFTDHPSNKLTEGEKSGIPD